MYRVMTCALAPDVLERHIEKQAAMGYYCVAFSQVGREVWIVYRNESE